MKTGQEILLGRPQEIASIFFWRPGRLQECSWVDLGADLLPNTEALVLKTRLEQFPTSKMSREGSGTLNNQLNMHFS